MNERRSRLDISLRAVDGSGIFARPDEDSNALKGLVEQQ